MATNELHSAAYRGDLMRVQDLMLEGLDINAKSEQLNGMSPLHCACWRGHKEVAQVLLEHGADVNVRALEENTPLHSACLIGYVELVALLLQAGAELEARDLYGNRALHLVCMKGKPGHVRTLELLLRYGAQLDVQEDKYGFAPLHLACVHGFADVVLALVEGGAAVNVRDRAGRTPLHMCVRGKHRDIALYLVCVRGVDVNARTLGGQTPLHLACAAQSVEVALCLLERGADRACRDESTHTPLDYVLASDRMRAEEKATWISMFKDPTSRPNEDEATATASGGAGGGACGGASGGRPGDAARVKARHKSSARILAWLRSAESADAEQAERELAMCDADTRAAISSYVSFSQLQRAQQAEREVEHAEQMRGIDREGRVVDRPERTEARIKRVIESKQREHAATGGALPGEGDTLTEAE